MSQANALTGLLSGRTHVVGGVPTVLPDVVVCSVLLPVFIIGAVLNVRSFVKYQKQLRWQMANFGFNMARITTLIMRIVWSQYPTNTGVAIASQVFNNAGTIVLVLIVIMMCKKTLFRTHYDHLQANPGKKRVIKTVFAVLGFGILAFLAILIVGAVQTFLTTDPSILTTDAILRKVGSTALFVFTILPFPILAFNAAWRMRRHSSPAKDSANGIKYWSTESEVWRNSALLLLIASCLVFEYGFKIAQTYGNAMQDHWYYDKGAFYCTVFVPEIIATNGLLALNMAHRYGGYLPKNSDERIDEEKISD